MFALLHIFRLSEKQIIVDIQRVRQTGGTRDRLTGRSGRVQCWSRQDVVTRSDQPLMGVVSRTQCSVSRVKTLTKTSLHSSIHHSSVQSITRCDPDTAVLSVKHSVSCDNRPVDERNQDSPVVPDAASSDLTTQLPCQRERTRQSEDDLMYSSRELVRWDPCMSPIQGSESFRIPFIESVTMESSFDESMPDLSLPCQPNCTMVTEERKMMMSYSSQSVHLTRPLVNSLSLCSVMAEQSWLPRQPNCTLASIVTETESDRSEAEDWEGSRQGKVVEWEEGKMPGDEGRTGSLRCSTPEPRSSRLNFTVSLTFVWFCLLLCPMWDGDFFLYVPCGMGTSSMSHVGWGLLPLCPMWDGDFFLYVPCGMGTSSSMSHAGWGLLFLCPMLDGDFFLYVPCGMGTSSSMSHAGWGLLLLCPMWDGDFLLYVPCGMGTSSSMSHVGWGLLPLCPMWDGDFFLHVPCGMGTSFSLSHAGWGLLPLCPMRDGDFFFYVPCGMGTSCSMSHVGWGLPFYDASSPVPLYNSFPHFQLYICILSQPSVWSHIISQPLGSPAVFTVTANSQIRTP